MERLKEIDQLVSLIERITKLDLSPDTKQLLVNMAIHADRIKQDISPIIMPYGDMVQDMQTIKLHPSRPLRPSNKRVAVRDHTKGIRTIEGLRIFGDRGAVAAEMLDLVDAYFKHDLSNRLSELFREGRVARRRTVDKDALGNNRDLWRYYSLEHAPEDAKRQEVSK